MNNNTVMLVTVDRIKKDTSIMANIEEQFITEHIFEAQDIDLQSVLGREMYAEIINQFKAYFEALETNPNADIANYVSEDNKILVDDYITQILIYYTRYYSIYDLNIKYTNKGTVQKKSQNSEAVDIVLAEKMRKDFKQKGNHYITEMVIFVNDNIDKYPLFKGSCETKRSGASISLYLGDE